jgi:hypothetical protein
LSARKEKRQRISPLQAGLDSKQAENANRAIIESGAQFDFNALGNKKLSAGQVFTTISNTSTSPSGTSANLGDGSTFTAGRNNFQVNTKAGIGNDLMLISPSSHCSAISNQGVIN